MFIRFLICFSVFMVSFSEAQVGFSASHKSRADTYSVVGSPESVYTNLLFFESPKNKAVFVSYQKNYLIPELNEQSLAFYYSKAKMKLAMGIYLLGLDAYADYTPYINVSYDINKTWGSGIGFGFRTKKILNYETTQLYQISAFTRVKLSKKADIGASALFFQEEKHKFENRASVGLLNRWSKFFITYLELEKYSYLKDNLKFSFELLLTHNLKVLSGANSRDRDIFLGAEINTKPILFSASFHFPQTLRVSPGTSLGYVW